MTMRKPTPMGEICTVEELDALRSGDTMLEGMYKMMLVTLNSPDRIPTPYDDFLMKLTTQLLADEIGGLTHREHA